MDGCAFMRYYCWCACGLLSFSCGPISVPAHDFEQKYAWFMLRMFLFEVILVCLTFFALGVSDENKDTPNKQPSDIS